MYIESVQINNFGNLINRDINLKNGLNIIEGDNESGKSTLASFIKFIFYGFSGKNERVLRTGFSTETAEGSLILNCGAKRYRIERRAVGVRENCAVYDLSDGSRCFKDSVPGEHFFGIPENLFESSAYVGQADGNRIDGKSTGEAVDNLLFSADENINIKKAIKRLDDAKTGLLYKNKKGGKIYELEKEIAGLKSRYADASGASAEIISLEGSISEFKNKIKAGERKLGLTEKLMSDYEVYERRRRNKRVEELEGRLDRSEKELTDFREENTRNGFFPDKSYLDSLKIKANDILLCDRKIAEIEKTLNELEAAEIADREAAANSENEEEIKKKKLRAKRGTVLAFAIVFCVLFIPSVSVAVLTFLMDSKLGIALGALAALFLVGAIVSFVFSSRYTAELEEISAAKDNRDGENRPLTRRERCLIELDAKKEEKAGHRNDMLVLCDKWGIKPSVQFVTEVTTALDEMKRLSDEAEKNRVAYITLKQQSQEYEFNAGEDDGRIVELPEGFDIRKAKLEKDFLVGSMKSLGDQQHKREVRLAEINASVESPSALVERITAAEYLLKKLNDKFAAYELASEKLIEAGESLRSGISPRLSEYAGEMMGGITDGKHRELGIGGDLSMTFRPETESGGRITKGDEYMSAGTADAAYVSLRLALISLICRGSQPPLIFDESFARLDDVRLSNILNILAEAGMEKQVIVLTSSGREADACKIRII